MRLGIVLLSAIVLAAFTTSNVFACEPIHKLKLIEGTICDDPDKIVCDEDPPGSGQPGDNCRTCTGENLCWASDCRTFGGSDKGTFGQFKMPKGDVEAIIMEVENVTRGETYTLVDQVSNPSCGNLIPQADAVRCSTPLYKVKSVKPDGEGNKVPLCAWDNLDDVSTIAGTPKSAKLFLTDLNGKQCKARNKPQYWLFYKTCCRYSDLADQGDVINTLLKVVLNKNGSCVLESIREHGNPDIAPAKEEEPCL